MNESALNGGETSAYTMKKYDKNVDACCLWERLIADRHDTEKRRMKKPRIIKHGMAEKGSDEVVQ